eukprot:gene1918-33331_t
MMQISTLLPLLSALMLISATYARTMDAMAATENPLQKDAGRGRALLQGQTELINLAVVTTGGTIASLPDADGNLVPAVDGSELLKAVVGLEDVANITGIYPVSNIDSSEATPGFWKIVAGEVQKQLALDTVDAVLVLHGTDSMQQTAWYLQCINGIGNHMKPTVLTGAMYGARSPFSDGPGNILSSAVWAASALSQGAGVNIQMAGKVFSSRYVTKMDANNPSAFGGSNGFSGPVAGVVGFNKVVQYSKIEGKGLCPGYPLPDKHPKVALLQAYPGSDGDMITWLKQQRYTGETPKVALLQACPGSDGGVITWSKQQGYTALVIDGLGSGNIGSSFGNKVKKFSEKRQMKFVISSTPLDGITDPGYGCGGCLGELMKYGVVQAINLDAFQARIMLMLALAEKPRLSINKLQAMYNETTPMTTQSE